MIQATAAISNIRGVLWLQKKRTTVILGSILTTISFGWFFYWYLNLPNYNLRGLEGVEQSILFVMTTVVATGFNYLGASIIQHLTSPRIHENYAAPKNLTPDGIEMLRTSTLATILHKKRNSPNA